jgi:hypothetical protein
MAQQITTLIVSIAMNALAGLVNDSLPSLRVGCVLRLCFVAIVVFS